MFPFKTNSKSFTTNLSTEEIRVVLSDFIHEKSLFSLSSDQEFYGKIYSNKAKYELGHYPNKNGFAPQVVLKWTSKGFQTECICYFRTDNFIVFFLLSFVSIGVFISIKVHHFLPILAFSVFCLILYRLFQFIYTKSMSKTEILNELLIQKLKPNTNSIPGISLNMDKTVSLKN